MTRTIIAITAFFLFSSCVPVRIAPSIQDYKVMKGRRFKKGLSKRYFFIFEDPKEANQFYNYVNTKFELQHQNVYDDIPFKVDGEQFFFAFYEVNIPNKTLNFGPAIFNSVVSSALNYDDEHEFISGNHVTRNENWYVALEVYSDLEKDCLNPNSLSKEYVLTYLRYLKKEYLTTHNYNETLFKN
ncbi:hypothetical protein D1013_01070 [Euzebyella marina]|uniref:Lipoprotein n=1 Tax=Euzebyella marina TaxID=1761453 RepID=A0A3G2L1E8_9FLAO|nr:hypothetical protein [Euzebyella marina]AYN66069.1 hypothetical protein D1013_01070 [Euzebyella marina]